MHHIKQRVPLEFKLYREFFRALSNQTRFAIVRLLREKPHYVGELVEVLVFEQSRVSHNLGCLLNCGFVQWEWQGKNKVYRLHPDLVPILAAIDKHILKYAPALESCGVLEGESQGTTQAPGGHKKSRHLRVVRTPLRGVRFRS
jgi:DNA-binding transcriptional ArsR family regulator